jgi:hypothetical protein
MVYFVVFSRINVGIDFVKINDEETAKKFGIVHTPALVYFRKRTPMIYDGRSSLFHLIHFSYKILVLIRHVVWRGWVFNKVAQYFLYLVIS